MAKSTHINCEETCKDIHGSLGKLTHLVQLLGGKTQLECRKIREKYLEMYGEDLFSHLPNTQILKDQQGVAVPLAMLVLNPHERDAISAREALFPRSNRDQINYKVLVEIYAGRKSSHFLLIQQAYRTRFRRHLDQDILGIEPPHPYQKILMALAASHKAHSAIASQHIANCDARRLYRTGEGETGSGSIDEAVVLEILSKRSIDQFKLTLSIYKHIYGHNYTKALKEKYYGDFVQALRVVAKFISDPPKSYAKALYANINGMATDNGELARIMVSRAEVDMNDIQKVYKKRYGMELREAISESGLPPEYREFLVAIIDPHEKISHNSLKPTADTSNVKLI